MGKRMYKHLCKHYHIYSFTANTLSAIGLAGLALLGVISDTMTVAWLVGWAIMFAALFGIGQLVNQEVDDLDKVKEHSFDESNCIDKE